jgi:hypothetical protein
MARECLCTLFGHFINIYLLDSCSSTCEDRRSRHRYVIFTSYNDIVTRLLSIIVPIQTRMPPDGVIFEMVDITNGLRRFGDHTIDLVHARAISLGVCVKSSVPLILDGY